MDRIRTATDENIGFGWAIGSFLGVFMGSFAIGVSLALLTALLLKYTELRKFPSIESCIVALLAYSTYLLSNAIQLSGRLMYIEMILDLIFRNRLITILWYGHETLRLWQPVNYFQENNTVFFPSGKLSEYQSVDPFLVDGPLV